MSVETLPRQTEQTAPEWEDPAPSRPIPFWRGLAADIRAHVSPERYPRTGWGWFLVGLRVVFGSSGFRAVLLYRTAHTLRGWLGPVGRVLAAILFWVGRHWYGCSIASSARLHGGLILPHPQGIVIGAGVVVGPRSWLFHNVTLGGVPGRSGMPRVGADARIYAGAVICGPILVGDNVMIGANVVVSRDVPARSAVRPPAAVVQPIPECFRTEEA
jgi:serine O-acetyltransferase